MKLRLIFWTITVGLGGLLFGLDVAVISGAEKKIQDLWQLSALMHGFVISSALIGTIIGAGLGNFPADKLGRKKSLFLVGIVFFISSIGAALSYSEFEFIVYRFLGGLSIGASSVIAPLYISEISPAKNRGKMVMTFQLNIVFGILLAYFSNFYIESFNFNNDWRWMLGIVAFPSLIFIIFLIFTPESPRWIILHGKNLDRARKTLALIEDDVELTLIKIKNSMDKESNQQKLFKMTNLRYILLTFLIAFFNQLSGINAIIYYAPRIFETTGLGEKASLYSTIGIGIINFLSTILGWYLIDKVGRKLLMYIGSFGYIISLSFIAFGFYSKNFAIVPFFIYFFILSHAIGQGAVIWVFISEIFPNNIRSKGTSWGCWVHWFFAAIVTYIFPYVNQKYSGTQLFSFFAIMMIFQLIYVWKLMPETKGQTLEDMDLIIKHA